jgi:hypothetical protein
MTCLLDASSAGLSTASTYPLTLDAIASTPTRQRGPRTCAPMDGTTSESSASVEPSSVPETTAITRPTARSAAGRLRLEPKPCSKCGEPRPLGCGRGTRLCDACREKRTRRECVRCGGERAPSHPWLCSRCEPVHARRDCRACGRPKGPGQGRSYCDECAEVRREAVDRRVAAKAGLGRKPCRGCQRANYGFRTPAGKRSPYCPTCQRARSAPRPCAADGCSRPVRQKFAKLCVECFAVARERERVKGREWRLANAERLREKDRQRPDRGRSKRSKRQVLETRRMSRRLKRGREGGTVRMVGEADGSRRPSGERVDRALFPALPSAPLVAAIHRQVAREREINPLAAKGFDETSDGTLGVVCYRVIGSNTTCRKCRTGVALSGCVECYRAQIQAAARQLYRLEHETRTVQFDTADAILTRAGWLWFDVWQPCPGDARHYHDVAMDGRCQRCEDYCTAEEAFTSERTGEELPGAQQSLDVAA